MCFNRTGIGVGVAPTCQLYIEAVSIAYAQEGIKHPRPQTHDLIIDIIESLNGNIDEVVISDLHDNTYFAEIF